LESDVDLRGVCDNGAVLVMDNTAQKNFSAAIERNPDIVSGALVFRGTRVPVAALFENLKDGASIDEFLSWFPGVDRQQVFAVLDDDSAFSA